MVYFKENRIKKQENNYRKYSGNYCINQFLRYIGAEEEHPLKQGLKHNLISSTEYFCNR